MPPPPADSTRVSPGNFRVLFGGQFVDSKQQPSSIIDRIGGPHPYGGTIDMDADVIMDSDPTTHTTLNYEGEGVRNMFDRRIENFQNFDVHLFTASCSDAPDVEVSVNSVIKALAASRKMLEAFVLSDDSGLEA